MRKIGLYIHLPFCKRKCNYCDFCSFVGKEAAIPAYVDALLRQAEAVPAPADCVVDSVYFGGGTPSLLPSEELARLVHGLFARYPIERGAEVTCEVNPGTVDYEKFCLLKRLGINRISLGIQSLRDNELALLGRIHTANEAKEAFLLARRAGFQNISVDLMTGIPDGTEESLRETVRGLLSLSPDHVSSYALKIEEGTPFAENRERLSLPDEEGEARAVELSAGLLTAAGFYRYEISNYAKPGKESRHNLHYWRGEEYIGLGPSAYSYLSGVRYGYARDLDGFLAGRLERIDEEMIDRREEEREFFMLRLRLAEGIPIGEYKRRFGRDFQNTFGRVLQKYAPFLTVKDGRVALNGHGMLLSNPLIGAFLEALDEIPRQEEKLIVCQGSFRKKF